MTSPTNTGHRWLLLAALISMILWQIPGGNYLLYPFTILATWFHEMGHGLAAILNGGQFHKLFLFADGSGLAAHSEPFDMPGWQRALIAAGGPLGAPVAGALFILAGRRRKSACYALVALGGLLLLSVPLWVRSLFGIVAITLLGLLILVIAGNAPPWLQRLTIQLLGVQACVSSYQQAGYLFTRGVTIDGRLILSDSEQMAHYLGLTYWFWGGVTLALSLVILLVSLGMVSRK